MKDVDKFIKELEGKFNNNSNKEILIEQIVIVEKAIDEIKSLEDSSDKFNILSNLFKFREKCFLHMAYTEHGK